MSSLLKHSDKQLTEYRFLLKSQIIFWLYLSMSQQINIRPNLIKQKTCSCRQGFLSMGRNNESKLVFDGSNF